MAGASEISKIYSQYQDSLETAQGQFNSQLKEFARFLQKRYDDLLKDHVRLFRPVFENQIERARALTPYRNSNRAVNANRNLELDS